MLSADVERLGGIGISVERRGGIGVCVERRGGLSVSVSLVSAVDTSPFLRVKPTEVRWIDINNPLDYSVYSNVDWFVN